MNYHISFDIDFRRNTSKGTYICIEGIDGSGKTTQVEKISKYFEQEGREVVRTSEPRKDVGIIGKLIHDILEAKIKVPSVALQYLFTAERAIHHAELILPALERGAVVVSDRCFWSAVPYGILDVTEDAYTTDKGKIIMVAQGILSMYHQFTVPDKTFYLDVSVDTAFKRLSRQHKTAEIYEDHGKLEKICKGYAWLLKEFPKEFIVVDGEKSEEDVMKDILDKLPK